MSEEVDYNALDGVEGESLSLGAEDSLRVPAAEQEGDATNASLSQQDGLTAVERRRLSGPDKDGTINRRVLFVSRFQPQYRMEDIKALFETYGRVNKVKVIDKIAFVDFENQADAELAKAELHLKAALGAVELVVEFKIDRQQTHYQQNNGGGASRSAVMSRLGGAALSDGRGAAPSSRYHTSGGVGDYARPPVSSVSVSAYSSYHASGAGAVRSSYSDGGRGGAGGYLSDRSYAYRPASPRELPAPAPRSYDDRRYESDYGAPPARAYDDRGRYESDYRAPPARSYDDRGRYEQPPPPRAYDDRPRYDPPDHPSSSSGAGAGGGGRAPPPQAPAAAYETTSSYRSRPPPAHYDDRPVADSYAYPSSYDHAPPRDVYARERDPREPPYVARDREREREREREYAARDYAPAPQAQAQPLYDSRERDRDRDYHPAPSSYSDAPRARPPPAHDSYYERPSYRSGAAAAPSASGGPSSAPQSYGERARAGPAVVLDPRDTERDYYRDLRAAEIDYVGRDPGRDSGPPRDDDVAPGGH